MDVHKDNIVACVLRLGEDGKVQKEKRRFGTMTQDLRDLAQWLKACGVTHVAMEATGVYWHPVWNVLEDYPFEKVLINPQPYKGLRGKKTDMRDGERIGDLLQHGLLSGSFVPTASIRGLREIMRYRARVAQARGQVANRVQKVMEDANIKLGSVAADILGTSGQTMLQAIVAGCECANELAEMAKGKLRIKIPTLRTALEGRIRDHHRFMLGRL